MSSRITTISVRGDEIESWRQLASELMGLRRREFDDLNRRYGLTQHRVWMQRLADGSHQALMLHEGVHAEHFLASLAASSHPFDRWLVERLRDLHGHDLSRPLPTDPAVLALDWRMEPDAARPRSAPPPPPSRAAQRVSSPSSPPSPPRLRSTPPPLPPRMRPGAR